MESEVKQRNTWRLRDLRREIDASNWALARVHLPPSHFQARVLSQLVSQYGSFSFPFSFAFEYLFLPNERAYLRFDGVSARTNGANIFLPLASSFSYRPGRSRVFSAFVAVALPVLHARSLSPRSQLCKMLCGTDRAMSMSC